MTLQMIQELLGWCTVINIGILLVWALFFVLAHNFMYRMHSRIFKITQQQFDALHYGLIGGMKILLIIFNLVPYLAIELIK